MAQESGIEGMFILIAKKQKLIEVLVSRRYLGETLKRQREVIRKSFAAGFERGSFDEGLKRGVAAVGASLSSAQRSGELSGKTDAGAHAGTRAVPGKSAGPLVLRNQVRLTLSGAQVVIAAAKEKAHSLNLKVNVAVVDDGGHLIAFERMDGARPASAYTAITKATSAATFRQASGPLGSGGANPDMLLNLSLQNAAAASGGKITTLFGGIPVVVDEQVIGAVGVGGGTGEQDSQIGKAGIAALLEQLEGAAKKEPGDAEKPR
jgi:glc operon protein GlcG